MSGAETGVRPAEDGAARALRVLEERARALARRLGDEAHGEVTLVATFRVDARTVAVEARHVREVLPRPEVSRVGASAGLLRGVVNVRGEVVPVADLRDLLGLPPATGAAGAAVLLAGSGPPLGLLVDEPGDLTPLPADSLVPPPPESAAAVVAAVGENVLVLDAEAVLGDERLRATKEERASALERARPRSG